MGNDRRGRVGELSACFDCGTLPRKTRRSVVLTAHLLKARLRKRFSPKTFDFTPSALEKRGDRRRQREKRSTIWLDANARNGLQDRHFRQGGYMRRQLARGDRDQGAWATKSERKFLCDKDRRAVIADNKCASGIGSIIEGDRPERHAPQRIGCRPYVRV